jgi:hypothetical protein
MPTGNIFLRPKYQCPTEDPIKPRTSLKEEEEVSFADDVRLLYH